MIGADEVNRIRLPIHHGHGISVRPDILLQQRRDPGGVVDPVLRQPVAIHVMHHMNVMARLGEVAGDLLAIPTQRNANSELSPRIIRKRPNVENHHNAKQK